MHPPRRWREARIGTARWENRIAALGSPSALDETAWHEASSGRTSPGRCVCAGRGEQSEVDCMLEVWGGLLLGSIVSGVIPFINSELLVIGVAVLVPSGAIPIVAMIAGVGQMMAKVLLYGLARWAPSRLPERAKNKLEEAGNRVQGRGGATGSVVFASAALGWPPFYGVSLVAGALKVSLWTFVLLGLAGRMIRFGVLAWGARAVGSEAAQHLSATWTGWFLPAVGG